MPILGVIASSKLVGGDFESIATVTATGLTSTITFSSIPSTYAHLQIRALLRTNRPGGTGDFIGIRFNGDTGSNYIIGHQLYGDGSVAGGYYNGAGTTIYVERCPNTDSLANAFGGTIIDILDYRNTNKFKTTRALMGWNNNGAVDQIALASAAWKSTSAITSIEIKSGTGNDFIANTTFALYGIKGA